ncbi:hypothetical protein BM221_010076 [Beauveria bassiana]|uniref:Uncharacterized protein n=1 Tax=Beauveria bassiana TaxID=176275 RepID=A0A2N6N9E8_BEABA|nr:hypothetical protein BM221_010076 [Beauveria bassiana]
MTTPAFEMRLLPCGRVGLKVVREALHVLNVVHRTTCRPDPRFNITTGLGDILSDISGAIEL